jgi:hypothetical protein
MWSEHSEMKTQTGFIEMDGLSLGEVRGTLLWGGGGEIIFLLGGSQALLAYPSDKCRVKVKTLAWLELLPWDNGRENSILWISVELHNLERYVGALYSKGV